jgi:hypothetical protein
LKFYSIESSRSRTCIYIQNACWCHDMYIMTWLVS